MSQHARRSMNEAIESGDVSLFENLMRENCPVDVDDNRGWCPLHVAAHNGRLSFVQRLLQHEDVVIDRRTRFRDETALWLATFYGHFEVCKCLLENGAQVNIADVVEETPLHIAARNRHLDCARLLVEFGADVNAVDRTNVTPSFYAALVGVSDMVTLLIESGANIYVPNDKGCTPLLVAAQMGHLQCLQLIHDKLCYDGNANVDVEANNGKTPLIIAAQCGRLDCVQFLLNQGADADHVAKDKASAIHLATWQGHLGCVKALLPRTSQHALLKACYGSQVTEDPDWLPTFLDRVKGNCALELPNDGVSVLHLAVEWDRLEILEHLLESGMHPDHYIKFSQQQILNATYGYDVFQTALGLACYRCNLPMVTVLLDHGAQFTLGNDVVCNPLHCALAANCPPAFVRFLVERGADINSHAMDDNRVSPAISIAFKHPHLLRELLVLGGRLKNWDPEVLGGVGQLLVDMARDRRKGHVLLCALLVLARFAPRHQFRPLFSTLKSICVGNPIRSCFEWTNLDQQLASPESLLQLCRLRTRDVLMMRRGFHLESDVSTLELPQTLREYLMFR